MTKQPAPRIVALKRRSLEEEGEWGRLADVYADYLEQEQWGRGEPNEQEQGPEKGAGEEARSGATRGD